MAGKKYIWQKAFFIGNKFDLFFLQKNKSNLLPIKKYIKFTIYLIPRISKKYYLNISPNIPNY